MNWLMERVEIYQEGRATYKDIWWGFTSRYLSKEEAATDELAKKEKEETTATEGQK
jgi:hypothetical protein